MKYMILVFITLPACAKHHDADPETTKAECTERAGPYQVNYPDGQTRKSDVFDCVQTTGAACNYFYYVNDHSVTFTDCTEHLQKGDD